MTIDGHTVTLSVKSYVTKTTGKAGAMSNIVRSHIVKATEACGDFAVSIVAFKTGRSKSLRNLPVFFMSRPSLRDCV